jgi:hypothetical protein
MGWNTEDGTHEGYVASVVPDGRLAASYTGHGVIVDIGRLSETVVPDRDVIAWQLTCSCGWLGRRWARVSDPADHDPAQGRVYLAPDGHAMPPEDIEEAGRVEWWHRHAEPAERLSAVRDAARDAARATTALATAVRAARSNKATWAEIGDATGMTRQSAHQRWGTTLTSPATTTHREDTMEIIYCTSPAELFRLYDGEQRPQATYIELHLVAGTLTAEYHAPVSPAGAPIGVRTGHIRRYPLPILTATAANRVLDDIAPLAERILADWTEVGADADPSAVLGRDAEDAETEIRRALDVDYPDSDMVAVWSVADLDPDMEIAVTAATTDEQLAEIEAGILRDLSATSDSGAVVVPDLAQHLQRLRDRAQDQ